LEWVLGDLAKVMFLNLKIYRDAKNSSMGS
jgi:hypothetical protein